MDETCSKHGNVYTCTTECWSKNMIGRDHLEDLDVEGILKCVKNELMWEDRAGFI
jgi:hypothetical protein